LPSSAAAASLPSLPEVPKVRPNLFTPSLPRPSWPSFFPFPPLRPSHPSHRQRYLFLFTSLLLPLDCVTNLRSARLRTSLLPRLVFRASHISDRRFGSLSASSSQSSHFVDDGFGGSINSSPRRRRMCPLPERQDQMRL
jgi:hypothetical protein